MTTCLVCALALAAAPAEPADLFPAGVPAYAEVTRPGPVAGALAGFLKGTHLADALPLIDRYRPKATDAGETLPLAECLVPLANLFSPEALAEAPRTRGGAVALTGFDKAGRPEWVAVGLTGDSPAAALLFRSFLASDPELRPAGRAEGVTLYQRRDPNAPADPTDGVAAAAARLFGLADGHPENGRAVYAHAPGIVVAGSSPAAVTAVLRRRAGRAAGPALAASERFRGWSKLRAEPGVFVYAEPARLATRPAPAGELEPTWRVLLAELFDPKVVRSAGGLVSLGGGRLAVTVTLDLEPGRPVPLLDLLTGGAGGPGGVAGSKSAPELSVRVADGAAFGARMVALADAVAKADGELGKLPSDAAREAEAALKRPLAAVFGRVRGVTVVAGDRQTVPAGSVRLPMLLVTAAGEADARELEADLPRLLAHVAGDPAAEPVTESVDGQPVRSLALNGSALKVAHIARAGQVLAVGQDRPAVAALAAGAELVPTAGAAALRWDWGALADRLPKRVPPPPAALEAPQGGVPAPAQVKVPDALKKARAALADAGRQLPPGAATLDRAGHAATVTFSLAASPATGRLIDRLLEWSVESGYWLPAEYFHDDQ